MDVLYVHLLVIFHPLYCQEQDPEEVRLELINKFKVCKTFKYWKHVGEEVVKTLFLAQVSQIPQL